MYRNLVKKMAVALGLSRRIVGIKFLFIKEEYDDFQAEEQKNKSTFCRVVANAMAGKNIKANLKCFSCQGGPEMLGMKEIPNYVKSGKQFSKFQLYEDLAVSRQVQNDLCFVDQKIYGIAAGPLEEIQDADMVLFLCDAWQMMRVVQGYTFHYGMAKNIGMIGNQGICSDLVARPYVKNDINISVLCAGARMNTNADRGELGVGMPIHYFKNVVEGVIRTINPAMGNEEKKLLEARMKEEGIEFELEYGKMYTSYARNTGYPEELYKKELF